MDRPTIFLSSTVHDFGDLRSALKDYLELRGCRVLASEFTDFTRPLDAHSYDACLTTIEQADLFILFIGRRVGGWLDEAAKISITRAEYRHAYELAQTGRIKLLCFVRSDVYDHRQSIKDLERALKEDPALTDAQRKRLANHPSLAMEHAEAITSFIDEVTRNGETIAASKGLGTAPIANWISPFTTFTQVRQAIDPLIAHGLTVPQAAGRKALEVQLVKLLRDIVPIVSGGAMNPVNSVLNLRRDLAITSDRIDEIIDVPVKHWNKLVTLLTLAPPLGLDPAPLLGALGSDLLLAYDPAAGLFRETPEYEMLVHIVEQANDLKRGGADSLSEILPHGQSAHTDQRRRVPALTLVKCLHGLMRWVDLIGSARALAASLAGRPLVAPTVVPRSPVIDQEDQLASEHATTEQARAFIAAWPPTADADD